MIVLVDRNDVPKSEIYSKWYVAVTESHSQPFKRVFVSDKKKDCVEYAKTLTKNPIITSGRSYGAKW